MIPAIAPVRGRLRLLNAGAGLLLSSGIESPRLDAELLLASVLGVSRLELILRPSSDVPPAARRRFVKLLRARARHEPLAYLVGFREFYGREFHVDRRVLVPRPETEVLAGAAIAWLKARPLGCRRVLDLGTGSGCLAVSIALEVPGALVTATDLSAGALAVARDNVTRLAGGLVSLMQGDLFDAVREGAPFDLIVSNPPYVAWSELGSVDRAVREFEPRSAWLSGDDSLVFHRRIVSEAGTRLASDGAIMVEVGSGGFDLSVESERLLPGARAAVLNDLAGRPRVVVVDRSARALL